MLFPTAPAPHIFVPVRPVKGALSVFLAILEITLIATTVFPGLNASAFHVAHSKFTLVGFVNVSEIVSAKSLELPIIEPSRVVTSVIPIKSPDAILLAFKELSRVPSSSIVPLFLPDAMLHVVKPVALISCICRIYENTLAVGLIISPPPFIHVSVGMRHAAVAVCFVSVPHPLIARAIRPKLNAHTISFSGLLVKLTLVQSSFAYFLVGIYENSSNLHCLLL